MAHIEGARTYSAPPHLVWDVITDAHLYGEVAPNLVAVEIESGAGEGMVRRCTDTNGYEWTETVTSWEPERAYSIAVDVPESRFHRRLFTRFAGRWELVPRGDRVDVRIAFDFDTRYGPLGRLIAAYFRYVAPDILEAIFDGWERAIAARGDAVAGADEPQHLHPAASNGG